MQTAKAIKEIENRIGKENVLADEPMDRHLTMRVGGPADYFLTPENTEDLIFAMEKIRGVSIPYYCLGCGSNVIVSDEGFRGVIVSLKKLSDITVEENMISALSGARLRDVAEIAAKNSLSGFEFAAGIPGSLGGALTMNAGAYGGQMEDVTDYVSLLTPEGNVLEAKGSGMDFSYRKSIVLSGGFIVLSAALKLSFGDEAKIREKIADLAERRREKQPLEFPSCGSTFKRPEGHFAGKLIEESGLKGFRVGGAQVSEKHAGFIINRNKAKAADVIKLIDYVKETVLKKQGVELECEVKILK